MNSRSQKILKYLQEKTDYTTAKELAIVLDVSIRTIKYDIADINKSANAKVIYSSKKGYKINKSLSTILLSSNIQDTLPQTYEERATFITKQFIFDHKTFISVPKLCNSLYVSETTLRNDISNLNNSLKSFNLSLQIKNDTIIMNGNERDLRKFISTTIYNEVGDYYLTYDNISENFLQLDSKVIKGIIVEAFSKHNGYINDVALLNLVLHLSIIVDRVLNGKSINNLQYFPENSTSSCLGQEITFDISDNLERNYNIRLDFSERYEIFILVNANLTSYSTMSMEQLELYVSKEILTITRNIIKLAEQKYMINLSSDSFFIPFCIHIKNLIYRSRNNINLTNPSYDTIISGFPIVSDIAIFISVQLIDKYKINCPIGEISFLALHIGGEIERQKTNHSKVSTVLLCPSYLNIAQKLYNDILQSFSQDINIIKVAKSYDQLNYLRFELLISIVNVPLSEYYETITISPFTSQINKSEIINKIELCKNHKKNYILKSNFNKYFEQDLFWIDTVQINNSFNTITFICDTLNFKGYVNDSFVNNVLKRESISSTAFNIMAIPHSLESDAYKTSISIMINHKGIQWAEQTVKIVILLSISPYETSDFYNLYEALIIIFSNPNNVDMFLSCENFTDFKNILFSLIKKY